ncbi:hypothetical protein DACRYDRAFT_14517 [Dacryopinax primogenitus]|uniref:Uncharacterized protein n=1 Tax=Dacryopinax primogenitus (strain DJM 731) TaxID=1858805 RepID=M5GDD4_DACPD|nr:uncharacterized protein DACRYDRAFT_14517 [Dacryopinax primogenitus]EJU04447.1 hypothetical protein DACRYDRAFT_14517 [Dacryopinax primogenitus]
MSNSTGSFSFASFPALSGGLPTSPDEAPSIIFTIAYVALLPLAIWRTWTYRHPGTLLFTFVRLCLFISIRVATFALRAAEGASAQIPDNPVPSEGIFIAEQILLGVGFIVLVDLIVELLKSHIWRTDVQVVDETLFAQEGQRNVLQRIVRLMHVALIVSIALGIVAGTQYSDALTDPSTASNVKTLRTASTVIALVVSALCAIVSLFLMLQYSHLGQSRSVYLLVTSCIILVVPAYRLSTTLASQPSLEDLVSTDIRVKFYILQGLAEWLVAGLLVLVDVRVWFFAGGEKQMMLERGGLIPQGSAEEMRLGPVRGWGDRTPGSYA